MGSGDAVTLDLAAGLTGRPWVRHRRPFPWFQGTDVFEPPTLAAIERGIAELRSRGRSATPDSSRLSRNMPNSDAYGWNLPPDAPDPFAAFCAAPWHRMLADLFDVDATGDVNAAVHLHQPHSAIGTVHRDLGEGWFSDQPSADGANVMDVTRCSYTRGKAADGVAVRRTARAVTMIFYVGNRGWRPGDGGGTGLYHGQHDDVRSPAAVVPPRDNTILVFENTPDSWHSFLGTGTRERASVILWLHRTVADAERRWGQGIVMPWR